MRVAQIIGVAQDEEEADGSAEGNSNDLNQSLLPDGAWPLSFDSFTA